VAPLRRTTATPPGASTSCCAAALPVRSTSTTGWDRTRRGQLRRWRVVTVRLFDGDGRTVLMTWRFHRARPVALTYSPLLAMEAGLLMETIEIAFGRVEIE